jgi:Xaa-Pro aminopeptidase
MTTGVPKYELEQRIQRLQKRLALDCPDYDTLLITGRMNQYYLTGTMQDGLLVLRRDGVYFFVRKSFERALDECPLDFVYKINSYRDILPYIPGSFGHTLIESELMPVAMLDRLKKYFVMDKISPADRILSLVRCVKSDYELSLMERSGECHRVLLEEIVPSILREGMSECELNGELYREMLRLGHQGMARFAMFQAELPMGQLGFGDSSIYPVTFDGPGGMKGMHPSSPYMGGRERLLKKGDLIFVDVGFGVEGYHSDKTQVYSFGVTPSEEVQKNHRACVEVERRVASRLVAGEIPSEIYNDIMSTLPDCLSEHFMGYGEGVKFLGHGLGLQVDEYPVIARGFNAPLEENMVIALEPKRGIKGVGMVGCEDTYIVGKTSSRCVTGGGRDIIVV